MVWALLHRDVGGVNRVEGGVNRVRGSVFRWLGAILHKLSTRQGNETINFGGQEVKDQGHTTSKLDLEARRTSFST